MYDLAIIGGGINGCGIAADAAMRGLSTVLIEKNDLASHTSSASTKLIHGGLRYLEQCDFKLVKKSLDERQTLLQLAPHLIHPMPFVIAHSKQTRPAWQISIGLWLYDRLTRKNTLPKSRSVRRLQDTVLFYPLKNAINQGHLYYDCTTDDARLTIHNALLAKEQGANVLTHTTLLHGRPQADHWLLTCKAEHQDPYTFSARAVVNATGAWVKQIEACLGIDNPYEITLVQGSHLVVNKLYEGHHAYLLQHSDQRVIFAIPFYNHTLIGTTDVPVSHAEDHVAIKPQEISYLLESVNQYFQKQLDEKDIITSWSGVRTLNAAHEKMPQNLSREYALHMTKKPAPAICVYGGKMTTYRQLATETLDLLKPFFPNLPSSKTKMTALPGADGSNDSDLLKPYPWLPAALAERWLNTYGSRVLLILSACTCMHDLGRSFSADLYQREVDYLIQEEWARTPEDILWRRTKLGLIFKPEEYQALSHYLSVKTQG